MALIYWWLISGNSVGSAIENLHEIRGPILKTALSTVIAHPGLFTVDATDWSAQAISLVLLYAIAIAAIIAGWRLLLGFLIKGAPVFVPPTGVGGWAPVPGG